MIVMFKNRIGFPLEQQQIEKKSTVLKLTTTTQQKKKISHVKNQQQFRSVGVKCVEIA